MSDIKIYFAYLGIIVGLVSYVPYLYYILKGQTKPHAFSWLIWFILESIAFFALVKSGEGIGSWITGFTAVSCLVIGTLALTKGSRSFHRFDWFALVGSLVAIILWQLTDGPLLSVILITIIDLVAFSPTFRKAYNLPDEETATSFALSAFKYVFVLLALGNHTIITALYPLSLLFSNSALVLFILSRRKQIKY